MEGGEGEGGKSGFFSPYLTIIEINFGKGRRRVEGELYLFTRRFGNGERLFDFSDESRPNGSR